ncbi:unnamed protein product [Linum trigynum]|uniref:Uncharacterized protein n=1 Tax=Linum trigynum TaxID=586398 RepID=A0AAV2FEV5_9ROSI
MISFPKSSVTFSENVKMHNQLMVSGILGMERVDKHQKYSGLATVAGRSKKELFTEALDRLRKRLKGWKERTLSVAAREVLIKSVA